MHCKSSRFTSSFILPDMKQQTLPYRTRTIEIFCLPLHTSTVSTSIPCHIIHLKTLNSVCTIQQFACFSCTTHTHTHTHTHNVHTHTHTYPSMTWITVCFRTFSPHTMLHIIRSPSQEHCRGQLCHYDSIFARTGSWAANKTGKLKNSHTITVQCDNSSEMKNKVLWMGAYPGFVGPEAHTIFGALFMNKNTKLGNKWLFI